MESVNSAVLEQPPISQTPPPVQPPVAAAPKPQQMGLIGFVDDAIGRVFTPKAIKNAKGEEVGVSVVMKPRKDIAAALGKTNSKENKGAIDRAILGMSDEAFLRVKSEMAGLGADWTLAKAQHRTLGNGVRQISIVVKEIKRNTGPSDEEIAKSLKCSVEDVAAMRKRQEAALAEAEKQTIDVPPAEAPKPEGEKPAEAPATENAPAEKTEAPETAPEE